MRLIKSIARKIIFPALLKTGAEKVFSINSKNKQLILMYHGVVKKVNADISVNHLSVADFEKHLIYLKQHFKIVSLSEIFENYRVKKTPSQPTIAIKQLYKRISDS